VLYFKVMIKRGLVLIQVRLGTFYQGMLLFQLTSSIDYGSITLLFQDSVGGLEVQNPHTGAFQAALPIVSYNALPFDGLLLNMRPKPGTIVVNAADLLARWSNDVLRSTLHRVVAPPSKAQNETKEVVPARQSIAFFCNPNFDARITCLPSCYGPGRPQKYEAITTEKYIVQRLSDTIY
jgi:isopenicillin N synthase-like dioxygenase